MRRSLYALLCIGMVMVMPLMVKAQLTANFTSNIVSGCSPILVQFSDQSTGGATSWSWNLGNNTTSTLQNPSTTYITPGTYTVTLTVSNGSSSNTKTMVNYITVVPSPVINFAASDTVGACAPSTIQFTDLTNLNITGAATYLWDFGDGYTSTAQNPSHTYVSSGNYSVTLSVTNAAGCSKILTKQNYIHIVNKPTANFTAPITGSCSVPLTVNFTNTSTGATSYWWNFGNSNTSVAANPSATYTAVGAYNVTLVASLGNCSDTIVKPAFVSIGSLDASFTQSTTVTCTGNPVTFTNTSLPGPGNSTWYFGDGNSSVSTNATHAYGNPGTYTVTLVVNYNNCADTATSTVTINQGPVVQFTANNSSSCTIPFTVQFNNTTTGATSYSWDFGDGGTSTAQNPTHTYSNYGNYTVTLTATAPNGCTNTLSIPAYISVYQATLAVAANPPSGCAPAAISFTTSINPNVPVTNYTWNFGDATTIIGGASMSHTYINPGVYTVTVNYTIGQGCTYTSAPITVNIGIPPVAAFTGAPTNICPQGTVNFTNNSTGPTGTTYTWYFGDGGTSNQVNPNHTYNQQGVYTVTLVATNNGCSDTLIIPNMITVNPPAADFIPVYNCTNRLNVSFVDISQGASTWFWEFGDGQTSTQQSPTHTYPAYGNYTVKLTVTHQPSGCVSVREFNLFLYDMDAQFVADDTVVCKGQPVNFTATIDATAAPSFVSAYWYFGDGGTALNTGLTASHTYTTSGVYTVTLVVKDSRNCLDTFIKQNYITVGGPTANFSGVPTSGCAPLLVNFTDQSNSGGTGISARTWRFGDGAFSNLNVPNISHTYLNNGTYTVTLVVTDGIGCVDSLVRTNYITATKPTASFYSPDTFVCPGNTVHFTNTSSGANTYQWDFGDGGTSTATTPTHVYGVPGTYTVRLIATNSGGCVDTLIRTTYIHVQGMNLGFTASDTFATCPPLTVTFTNTSSGVNTFTWIFGNNNTSSIPSPTTIFTVPGVYHVKLIGQNGTGCVDTAYKTITVLGPTGTLSYSPTNGCLPLTVQFTSTNTNTQSLVWDMDNGFTQTTTASTYSYTYTQAGKYIPRLLLSDGVSCIVPIFGVDTIKVDKVDADFTYSPNNICQTGTINFVDTTLFAVNPIATRNWDFGDATTGTGHNPSHTYGAPGTYTVKLVIGSSMGCKDTVVKNVTILPAPTVSAGPNQSLCQGQTLNAQLQASGATSYVWSPAGGLSCSTCSNPVASPSVTTTYTVIGTATNGCKDTSDITVVVHPLPNVTTGASPNICSGSSIQLAATGATSYVWTPSTGLSCTNCQTPTASPSATTTYVVTGTDIYGCTDTAQTTVSITNLPNVTVTGGSTICAGANVSLQASGANSYSWTPTTGLSCGTCANPVATPTVTTTYIVTGTNGVGCSDTAMVTIVVNPLPPVNAGPNQSICLGTPAQLQATGAASYSWTPLTGLSCTNCANPIATINTTTTYTVTGTSSAGCINSSQVTVTVNTLPTITVSNAQTICAGSTVPLQVSGASTYAWSPSGSLSCGNCANPNAGPNVTTTYTVIGTDVHGCKDTADVTVNVNPLPNVDAGQDQSICKLATAQLNVTGASTYVWSPAGSLSCSTCANPVASPATTTTYTVTGTDANGCSRSDNVIVNIYPQPPIDAGPDQTICHGASVQLLATGGVSYNWTPGTSLSCTACPDPTASPANNITYTVVGTDVHGCQDSDKVTISVIQMQPFTIGPGDTLCHGESTQLSVAGGDAYLWLPPAGLNDNTISNPIANPDVTTTYTVIIKQGNCFSDTGYITVVVNPVPTVNAGADQTIYAGSSAMLFANATHTTEYLWTPSDGLSCSTCQSTLATPNKTTTYTVYVSNQYGCKSQDDVTVYVRCDNSLIFLANTFTPNGDGANDRFYPQGKGITRVNRFRIYNRWGEIMYDVQNIQPNDESAGWDGTYKGEPLKPDVYVYMVDAECVTGEPIQVKGDISLIR